MIARDGWPLLFLLLFLTGGSMFISPGAAIMSVFLAIVVGFEILNENCQWILRFGFLLQMAKW